jgi:hypothetical protein
MKLINVITNEVIAEFTTKHRMSLDEAILLIGEIFPANEQENVLINDVWHYYEDLDLVD